MPPMPAPASSPPAAGASGLSATTVKVTRSALQNAASIAGMFLTTEAVVADKPEPPAAGGDDAAAGMGGMY